MIRSGGSGGGARGTAPLPYSQTKLRPEGPKKIFLDGSGLGLMIFHKMSPRTHYNYL